MKKTLLVGVLSSVLALAFAVCSGMPAAAKELKGKVRFDAGVLTPREPAKFQVDPPPTYFFKLEKDYEKLHAGVDIEFIKTINETHETWAKTQLTAGLAPEIMSMLRSHAHQDILKGWYTDLTPYLDKPNPYVKGNKKWRDIFFKTTLDEMIAPNGKIYVLAPDSVETGIYYNKTIFNKVGISVPDDWDEFLTIQKKLKGANYTAFGFDMGPQPWQSVWAEAIIMDMVMADKIDAMDLDKSGSLTTAEFVKAIKRDKFSALDPQYREVWEIIKNWSQYFGKGFLSGQDCHALFIRQKIVMHWGMAGSMLSTKRAADKAGFDFGVFYIPIITKKTTKYAFGRKPGGIGGANGSNWVIPSTTVKNGLIDEAIDWLMYVTAPQNLGPLVSDISMSIPNVKGCEPNPLLKPFADRLENKIKLSLGFDSRLTPEFGNRHYKIFQQFMGGQLDLNEALKQIQKEMDNAADQLVKENPSILK